MITMELSALLIGGSVDGDPVGSRTLNILPNHHLQRVVGANVSRSQLVGGLSRSSRPVATFAYCQTSRCDSTLIPARSASQ